ncbi:MAG: N-acetylmuramoyl-L-alanine amidase [Actinomycetota bacterium]
MEHRAHSRKARLVIPAVFFATLGIQVQPASAVPGTVSATIPLTLNGTDTKLVQLPWKANLISVSLPGVGREARLEVGVNGNWYDLQFEEDHGPSGAEAARAVPRSFSEPLWLGTERVFAIRAAEPIRVPLKIHAINSKGDSSVAVAPLRILGSMFRALTVPRSAEAITVERPVIPRSGWGANESWRGQGPGASDRLDGLIVHHTDTTNSYSKSDVPAIIRGIYRYHTKTRGWSDIGYGLLIDKWGRVFEGRYGSTYEPIIGAQARAHNTRTMGIALLGDYADTVPTKASRVALARLVAWKADLHQMPPVGLVKLGDGGHQHKRVIGHRDANSTVCPGNKAYGYLDWVRRAANRLGHPKFYLPRQNTSILTPDGDGDQDIWKVTGWFSREVDWKVQITDAAGVVVHEATGAGRRIAQPAGDGVRWDGKVAGVAVPSGRYRWTLSGTDAGGRIARPVEGEFLVVSDHLDGTLLQDPEGVYWIDGGSARPVSDLALRTVFARRTPISVGAEERGRYSLGTPIAVREGSLLLGPDGTRYIRSDGFLRSIDPATFTTLGFRDSALIPVSTDQIATMTPGQPITSTTRHPAGTVVAERTYDSFGNQGATRYWRIRTNSRSELSETAVRSRIRSNEVVDALPEDLTLPVTGSTKVLDGTLLNDGRRWIISDASRRRFLSNRLFYAYGYRDAEALSVATSVLNEYPPGGPVDE